MAKRTARQVTVEDLPGSDEQSLDEFMSSLSNDDETKIVLYRRPQSGKEQFLGNFTVAELNEELIASEFGAGTYLIRPKKSGRWVLGSRTIHIDDNARGIKRPAVAVVPSSENNGSRDLVIAMMQQQNQRSHEMILALINRPSSGSGELITLLKETGMLGNAGGVGAGLTMAKDIITLAQQLHPAGEEKEKEPESMLGILSSVLKHGLGRNGGDAVAPAPQAAALPPGPSNNPPAETVQPNEQEQFALACLALIDRLKKHCALNHEPATIADSIDMQAEAGDLVSRWLMETAQNAPWPAIEAEFAKRDEDFKSNDKVRDWFKRLYDALQPEKEGAQ